MNSCKKYVYKNKTFFNTRFPFAIRHVDNLKADFNLTKRFCREFWKITYVVSGTGSFVINDRKFPIQPRSLFLVHPSAFTTFDINEEKLNLYNLIFDYSFVSELLPKIKDPFHYLQIFSEKYNQDSNAYLYLLNATREMEQLILGIQREFDAVRGNCTLMIKYRFYELLLLMLREGSRNINRSTERLYLHIEKILNERYMEPLGIKDIAAEIGSTPERISRVYRSQTGRGIIDVLRDRRLAHACNMLKRTALPISKICYGSGFGDLSYFFREFQAKFGMTPLNYRREHHTK